MLFAMILPKVGKKFEHIARGQNDLVPDLVYFAPPAMKTNTKQMLDEHEEMRPVDFVGVFKICKYNRDFYRQQ